MRNGEDVGASMTRPLGSESRRGHRLAGAELLDRDLSTAWPATSQSTVLPADANGAGVYSTSLQLISTRKLPLNNHKSGWVFHSMSCIFIHKFANTVVEYIYNSPFPPRFLTMDIQSSLPNLSGALVARLTSLLI